MPAEPTLPTLAEIRARFSESHACWSRAEALRHYDEDVAALLTLLEAREAERIRELQVTVAVERHDEMDAFGAYLSPSVLEGEAIVRLNIGAMVALHATEEDVSFKDVFIETVMHEVGHVLEETQGLPFDEERIERIIDTYRERYGQQTADAQ